jgi:GTP-binding protein Era
VQESWDDEAILRQVESQACPLIVLLNKVDLLREGTPLPPATLARLGTEDELLDRWRRRFPEASVLPISAELGLGTDGLLARIRAWLPLHAPFFPKDQLTDRPERFFAAEMVREAIFDGYRQEVPYSCEVAIDSFKELDEILRIKATIYVSHDTQKGIVIGQKGAALKAVATRARKKLEDFFVKQVYLQTEVKVRKNWRHDVAALRDFGYMQ